MPYNAPDPVLIQALRLVKYIGNPAEPVPTLWNEFSTARDNYKQSVASSLSSEGISRSMDADLAREQLILFYHAYTQALAALTETLPAGADPVLLQRPMGTTVDHSCVPLRC